MKSLLLVTALILFLSCSNETQITPDNLTSIEYGTIFGFTGAVQKITVYADKQVYQPSQQSSKTCQAPISSSEWNELRKLVDQEALRKVKVGEEGVCFDASSAWIIVRNSGKEEKAFWGPCTGGDPTGIQPLIEAMGKLRGSIAKNCN
ncbi:hypothetical protein [Fibrivirga algicola]|uniref:Lipoprotein n=1 Tax=Fibrivirga algicola TaxID=2950420 RepID=A0ABX0QFL9_9BACT|nr:hypothetical protein [Fibrivirga algicola]NID09528.1 hypothetical protein [Fibrivirga algicola]